MSTLSPNMSLVLPTIGIDSGLTWEQSVNINSGIVDGHNHSVGFGVQINPSGININADLPFNGFNQTTLRTSRFNAQPSPISLPSDLDCIYVSGVDLYYNDGNGNQVRMTSGGAVNATSSGISNGTATAGFSSGTLVVDSASNTPANIQVASILLGNTGVSGSNFLTLSPPTGLGSNYSLVLPPLPAQTNVMTLDTSGNMSSITYDQVGSNMTSTGADAIATTMGSTGANTIAANRTRSTGTTVGIGGIAVASSSGSYTTTSTSPVTITNQSITITTSGRPVQLMFVPDGTTSGAVIAATSSGLIQFFRASTAVATFGLVSGALSINSPTTVDFPSAGTYTYTVATNTLGSGTMEATFSRLIVFEL